MPSTLKYFAYISRAKVKQLHEQIVDVSVRERSVTRSREGTVGVNVGSDSILGLLKAGLSFGGRQSATVEEVEHQTVIQQLKAVVAYIEGNEKILDLGELCRRRDGVRLDAFVYTYAGRFFALGKVARGEFGGIHISNEALERAPDDIVLSKELLLQPARQENALVERGPNNGALVSNMALLTSIAGDFTVSLACSLKYFADMGGRWDERDREWEVVPHSGNYQFFGGGADAWFEAMVFVTGMRDRTIMGTPLFLVHGADPGLVI